MTELSLHILDIVQNSLKAGAALTEIEITASSNDDFLSILIRDNGQGMTGEQLARVEDPFYTTRTTRKIGLGVPLFKQAAEQTGGSFSIVSEKGKGTELRARFVLSSIDRMPMGDLAGTVRMLIAGNPNTDFHFSYEVDGRQFTLDTREMRGILGDIPLDHPDALRFVRTYLEENLREANGDLLL